jgi:hypothetical protein
VTAAGRHVDAAGEDRFAVLALVRVAAGGALEVLGQTAVKVGGMCCAINTGARSIAAVNVASSAESACGPPVEEPISSARGAASENGRRLTVLVPAASGSPPPGRSARRSDGSAAGTAAGARARNAEWPRPRVRTFSINSRRNATDVAASGAASGLGT